MNFLIIGKNRTIKESIIGSFMPLGVDIFHSETYEDAERYLLEKQLGMIFIDFDIDEDLENGLLFIDEILEEQGDQLPTLVVVSTRTSRELVRNLIEKRVRAFLVKPVDHSDLINRLITIKKRFHYVDTDKKYYRVKPPETAPLIIYLRSSRTSRLFKGVVKNISIGGASFETSGTIPDEDLTENDIIDKIVIKIGNEDVELGGQLLYKLKNICAVSFRKYTSNNLRSLSNYIFEAITNTPGKN